MAGNKYLALRSTSEWRVIKNINMKTLKLLIKTSFFNKIYVPVLALEAIYGITILTVAGAGSVDGELGVLVDPDGLKS